MGDRPRGGGKGGKRPPPSRDVLVSKKLSWLLRHGATSEKLALDSAGYANLADVLSNQKIRSLKTSFEEVRAIVAENDKQRFSIKLKGSEREAEGEGGDGGDGANGKVVDKTSTNPRDWMIRANQGHSVEVESEALSMPIKMENAPETVVHGTSHAAWTLIVASGGLKTMGRNHIHFASGLPTTFKPLSPTTNGKDAGIDSGDEASTTATTAPDTAAAPVISGMRISSTVLIYLNIRKALEAGIKFWRSENGVILSGGNDEGNVGLDFFSRVEDCTGEGVLLQDGVVIKEAPASWAPKGGVRGGRRGGRGRGG